MSQTSKPFISTEYTRFRAAYHWSDQSKFSTDTTRYIAELEKRVPGERAWAWLNGGENISFVTSFVYDERFWDCGSIDDSLKWLSLKEFWSDAAYEWKLSCSPVCIEKHSDTWVMVDV